MKNCEGKKSIARYKKYPKWTSKEQTITHNKWKFHNVFKKISIAEELLF